MLKLPSQTDSNQQRNSIQHNYKNDEWEKLLACLRQPKNYYTNKKSTTFRYLTPSVPDIKVPSNKVQTSKYNFITFLPKSLIIKFSNLAHIYYIFIGICQLFKDISTTNGTPAIFLPLSIIVCISMFKDFIEDWKRHVADRKENESVTERFNPENKQYEKILWQNIRIGDLIKINENEQFPADLVIIQTSTTNGDCFVETKNLDGETNIKRKIGISPSVFQTHDLFKENFLLNFELKYEQPNQQMYFFNGVLTNKENNNQYSANINNLCLRGSSLKASAFILGIAVYTGHQTKLLLNSQKVKYKFSIIEQLMNKMILWIFILLVLVCIFSSIYYNVWYKQKRDRLSYLGMKEVSAFEEKPGSSFFLTILLWFLLLGHFVPISLMVTLEIVKFSQGMILSRDKNYSNCNDDQFVEVKSSNLCEQLGRVNYIFSDKTGTLTINQMNFKAISLNGIAYQDKTDLIQSDIILRSQSLYELIESEFNSPSKINLVFEGMKCLNLCHTLIIEKKENKLTYCGTSPDEESILSFCNNQGFYLSNEDIHGNMTISISSNQNSTLQFRKIAVLEFDFERKKMSVIVEDLQTKQFKLYCKGADASIFSICDKNQESQVETTKNDLYNFSIQGLRTLAFGYKILTSEQVNSFLEKQKKIQGEIHNQEEKMQQLHMEMEKDLVILGGTGINDRLQDDVEYTLQNLKTAGIKIWMLTGDKVETAKNIALQCHLITLETDLAILDSEVYTNEIQNTIEEYYNKLKEKKTYSVLLTGYTLYAIDNELHKKDSTFNTDALSKFKEVLMNSQTVISCKISPKQKAQLVNIVQHSDPSSTTLAIGDGANDVSMISTAHIGVGIRGKEGRQAAKLSDFSIGEFRHLNRLILYQGQETYRKNTELIFFNFYKNQVGFLVYFWYNFFSGQCATFFYDQWVKQLYNLIFTALPIILYCLFDELYPAHEFCTLQQELPNKLERMPYFYKYNMKNPDFTVRNFWKNFFLGSIQAVIITYIGMACLIESPHKHGYPTSHMEAGMLIFSFAVIIPNLKVLSLHNTHYPFTLFFIFASIAVYFISFAIAGQIKMLDSYGLFKSIFSTPNAYFGIILMLLTTYGFQQAGQIWKYFITLLGDLEHKKMIEKVSPNIVDLQPSQNDTLFPSNQPEIGDYKSSRRNFAINGVNIQINQ